MHPESGIHHHGPTRHAVTGAVPGLESAFEVSVQLGPIEDHGVTRAGHRRVVPIIGGRVTGLFDAEILPGGADWQLLRADGAVDVYARYTARTLDGSYVLIESKGVRSGRPEVLEALLRGDAVAPEEYYFRTVLTLEASAVELAPLQNVLFIASAVRSADEVAYTAYRVT